DARSCGRNPSRIVLGIGQRHPVLKGSFARFQARSIAHIQAWIFRLCMRLSINHGVRIFGEEGFGMRDRSSEEYRLSDDALVDVRTNIEQRGSPGKFLGWAAQRWRKALRSGDHDTAGRM